MDHIQSELREIQKVLADLGLGNKEKHVLATLLENSPMLASAVASETKLNRTTTYGILKELTAKGLVSSTRKEGATRYQSIGPELLPEYIEHRRAMLAETKKTVAALVPQMQLLRKKGRMLPKVKFFEGKEGVEQAYIETLETNREKKLFNIVGIEGVYTKLDPTFVDYFLKKRLQLDIEEHYVTPDSESARTYAHDAQKYNRRGSAIPAAYTMDTEISIYDDKVGIFSFAQENPVALIIEDVTIANTMKQLFSYIDSTIQ